ncbi:uncharacterized protein C16orf46 homolog [Erinaceus europaeus]|uniref:Uncharacterized protein C16orf46 homolog n=1 Tax=Erinaceus europaeus TaxID=9365 RepID=A0ABM3WWZ7_ERIEU|nr:uncharacterized protein C16orf46 homolog [Erinaceus europaeus]XP_060041103.1 uncharacterized protein C16orf46 homolog [Erinaceus europaeus]
MDVCQKTDTELESSKNNEIQSTEEAELIYSCPDERSEKNHVCCLLSISDNTLEQDKKAEEFAIGTGWEEAVQGWGRTSSTACIWPRKKLKKTKRGESSSNCLLCIGLSQGVPEARSQVSGKLESGDPEKDKGIPSQTQGQPQGLTNASRDISKICFPTYSQGEKKSLQIKEFIWCMKDWDTPETVRGKDLRSSNRALDKGTSMADSLTSKALLVLPPLKTAAPKALDVLGKKSTNFLLQPEEKVLGVEKDECVSCTFALKSFEGKNEKRPIELAMHLKVNQMTPFPPLVAQLPLLADPDPKRCCLHWALLPERNLACPSHPQNLRYLTTLRLLQKHGTQNYRDKLKASQPRPPVINQKSIVPEAKQENEPQKLSTKLLTTPLLPSLSVSRVIPISTHRFL